MATRITSLDHRWALAGAVERRLVETPSGRQWAMIFSSSARAAKFFRSSNQGSTWSYSSDSDLEVNQGSTILSFHVDADGYAHVAWMHWDDSPQHIHYSRGTPSSTGRTWHWKTVRIEPAAGRLGRDADVVAFRRGTGWVVWVYWEMFEIGHRLSRIGVSANGSLTVEATTIDPGSSAGALPFGGLEFAHNGDGVTPLSDPHLYLLTGSRKNLPGSVVPDLRLHRGRYQSGSWTWGTSILLETATLYETTATHVWDGALVCVAWAITGSNAVRFATWDGVAGSATRLDPPALPAGLGAVNGISISHDPVTDDIFVAIHDKTDGDIRWTRLVRTSNTWTAWTLGPARPAGDTNHDNKIQLLRHPRFGNIDALYATYTSESSGTLFSERLLQLSRKPGVPALRSPANGALLALNNGGSFTWGYSPAGPGDTQQAWQFRRRYGTGTVTTEYWNASSQAWSATEVWNTGKDDTASFPAGRWPPATTYSWTVRTRSTSGVDSDYAPERTVVSTSAPVITVTGPEGIIYSESTPLVAWSYSSTDAQRDYEVRIVKAAGTIDPLDPGPAVWSSGVTTNSVARERRVEVPLDSDVAYRAYVRATSVAGLPSTWAFSEFSLSLVPPAGPLIGVLDDLAYPTDIPFARLSVQGRSNYMGQDQALGQAGWEAHLNATTAVQEADLVNLLEPSLSITTVGAGTAVAISAVGSPPAVPEDLPQPLGPLDFPVVDFGTYTALGYFRASAEARAGRVSVQWYNADDGTGTLISTSVGDQVNLTTSSYSLTYVTATAPEGARLGRVLMEGLGAAAGGEIFYVTRMSFHPGAVVAWQPGSFADAQTVRVERSDDEGATWREIISRVKTDYWQRAVAADRGMPLGRDVLYRAYTDVDLTNGGTLSSTVSPVSLVFVESQTWVIRDPDDAAGEVFAYVTGNPRADDEELAVHRPAGRVLPVIDSEGQRAPTGTLEIYVPRRLKDATVELLRRPKPLLVQSPVGEVLHVRFASRDYDVENSRDRVISAPYFEVG